MTKLAVPIRGGQIKPVPEPEISVVTMDEVPYPPPNGGRHGRWSGLLDQIAALKAGTALRLKVDSLKRGLYIRQQLRDQAKKRDRFLSSSRSADSLTWYFWLEPKE